MQSAPNCNKDDNEFDDDHESCHGLHLLFSIIIYDCFLHLLLTGLARYGPVYYPLESVLTC